MKKIVFVALVCFIGSLERVGAQVSFAVGVKAGVNVSNFNIKDPAAGAEINFQAGFNVGIITLLKISKFGIQPEVLFSRQGPSFKVSGLDLVAIQDYVNVPVVLKYYPIGGLNIQFGPQFGFLVAAEVDQLTTSPTGNVTASRQSAGDDFENIDIGLAMGLGWDFPFGLTVDARYNMGLTSLTDDDDFLPTGGSDAKSQVIQLSVGYKFLRLGED